MGKKENCFSVSGGIAEVHTLHYSCLRVGIKVQEGFELVLSLLVVTQLVQGMGEQRSFYQPKQICNRMLHLLVFSSFYEANIACLLCVVGFYVVMYELFRT